MRLEHESAEKLKHELLKILGSELDLRQYRVFFFGSRVAGTGTDRSDIDVGIEGPPIPTEAWFAIQDGIAKLPILYKIDLVEFRRVAQKFRDVAKQHVEALN